ncbi:DUF4249 family protein [Marinigracilibium pacificum]|uniref:DUF4249 family protein n=1 Tax=Marinigracilibium pacificum TaxID=2729599 RepID=A0A848J0F6_9BACT|nr:DUF4249 family protein [Marinigracilibium pacificum]NMM50037.1 DUF4249 family protein [Marinigracilibium pacificum]
MTKLFYILILMLLIGCIPDPLPVDNIPDLKRQPVVTNFNTAESFLNLIITQNFPVETRVSDDELDSLVRSLFLKELYIKVYVSGMEYSLDEYLNGVYYSPTIPKLPGEEYKIEFENPFNGKAVSSTAELMEKVGFARLESNLKKTEFDTLLQVNYEINDPIGKNWYMINVKELSSDFFILETPYVELIEDAIDTLDQRISGSFTIPFKDFQPQDTILISLSNIDQTYFEFLDQRKSQQFILIEELSDPITYNTNINNGLGIFTLHQPDIHIIFPE